MFPVGKGRRCHLHVPIVMKSGSLNLFEPSGPVKACNGIALPLPLPQILGWENVDWSSLYGDRERLRVVNTVVNLWLVYHAE
jgi:hypothetical protein